MILACATLTHAQGEARNHTTTLAEPVLVPEDGLLLGNGDLSVSVYQQRNRIVFRFGKGDVWDRRLDTSDDPRPPHIDEIAHGIAVEGWKCPPYGGAEAVALNGTDNPERMKEVCSGAPPSYVRRPYPCPKPVGELAVQLPQDLPALSVRQELTIEEDVLRITCESPIGVGINLTAFIPPETNVLVVRWSAAGWGETTRMGQSKAPVWFSLYRWADPSIGEFGELFYGESRHGAFLGMDYDKCSPLPPPENRTIDGRHVIEQSFHPEPTFPQGFRYQLVPLAPEGTQVTVRPDVTKHEARIHVVPPVEATEGWVAIAVPSESDDGGTDAERERIVSKVSRDPDAAPPAWEASTLDAAREFWSHSSVMIDDPAMESLWYETYHARRCTTRVGKTPPGLFLPSTVRDYSHWHGDYHTNYNYQQPFWGDFAANQLAVGDAYFTGMAYLVQMGRIIAERYYGTRGVFIQLTGYPILSTDDCLGAVPMGRLAYMTGWASNHYWWRYLYTRDKAWLREVGYPVIRDCALFYTDFMALGDDGLYHVFPSNQGEDGFSGNAKDYTDRAQVMQHLRHCLRSAISASEILDTDPDIRVEWQKRLNLCAGDDGRPPEELEGMAKHFADASPPELGRGRPYEGPLPSSGGDPWPLPAQGNDLWYVGQYPVALMPQLRAGTLAPDRCYAGFRRIVERWRHPNGLLWGMSIMDYGHSGAWTETLGICAPLQEMMLQSFGGVLRIFPCWPTDVDASFSTFRAEGAFLVSAAMAGGEIQPVAVLSESGGRCRLYSPWPGGLAVSDSLGNPVDMSAPQDGIHSFDTVPGGRYTLRPAG